MTARLARPEFRVEPLSPRHDRAAFGCGDPDLDRYLHRQARQDLERNLAAVFVLTPNGTDVAGFYALSAHSIHAEDLPRELGKKLPRFPLPVTLLGRMAVGTTVRGRGLGEFLLMHALERAWIGSQQVASWAVVVDAKAAARDFYTRYDFVPLLSSPNRLFLPMKTVARLFAS